MIRFGRFGITKYLTRSDLNSGIDLTSIQFHFIYNMQEYLEEYVGPNTRRAILYQVRNVKAYHFSIAFLQLFVVIF